MIIRVVYSKDFLRLYKKLEPGLQGEVKEKITLFSNTDNHERLRVHKLKGTLKGLYSFSVTHKVRIVFSYVEVQVALLTSIGTHDDVY